MGVDGDITVNRQRAAIAKEYEALGVDVRNGVIEIKGGESLRAAVEVEDRGLSGVVHHQGRAGVELLSPAGGDADDPPIDPSIPSRPVGDGRHVHGDDPVAKHLSKIPDPFEQAIGNPWRCPAPAGNFTSRI